jgi:hypothetical protein
MQVRSVSKGDFSILEIIANEILASLYGDQSKSLKSSLLAKVLNMLSYF